VGGKVRGIYDMTRVLFILIVLLAGNGLTAPAQTTIAATDEDCGCEWQVARDDLAIVNGVPIAARDIDHSIREAIVRLQREVVAARKRELDLQINSKLVALEAKKRAISVTQLLQEEVVSKVKSPTEAEVQAFYDQNKERIKGEFPAVREHIIQYLRDEREREQALSLAQRLRTKIETQVKVTEATPPRIAADRARVFATVNGEQITSADIEDSLRPMVQAIQQQIFALRKQELELRINDTLLEQEARKRRLTTEGLLDTEIKPKTITEDDARTFYEQNKDRVSGDFAQTKAVIVQYLQQQEKRSAELLLVERLRRSASIQTFLVAPSGN
jgi:hypothetical protein